MGLKVFIASFIILCALGCGNNTNPVSHGNNSPPVIQAISFFPDTIVAGESCLIEVKAVDSDNDKLTYEWNTPGSISGSGSKIFFSPGSCCGAPKIVVTVSDGNGGSIDSGVVVPFRYE
jgi:hypothetical protein